MKKTIGILAISVIMASCGGGETKSDTPKEKPKSMINSAPKEKAVERPADLPEIAELTIEGDDMMKFNLDRMEVWEGQTVKLTLKHTGTMPVESMGHNWTLLKPGVDIMDFGAAAATAKANDYLPEGKEGDVIAKTKTIGGGEEVTIEFAAPTKGTYDFICAFPGHYGMMKGKFVVK